MVSWDLWGDERRRTLTPGDKKALLLKSRGKCEYCGRNIIAEGVREEIHHIRAFADGGSDRESNLIVLCPNCHSRVDLIPYAELKKKIEYRLPKKKMEKSESLGLKRKTTQKKTVAKKATAKKGTAKKTTAKRTTAKKITAKRTTAKKITAKRTTAKKVTGKKTTTKKTTAARK